MAECKLQVSWELEERTSSVRTFIPADGGMARIVWMPKELKEHLREDFVERSIEAGLGADFFDKIADETVGTTTEEITAFLEENGHPCFDLEPLM